MGKDKLFFSFFSPKQINQSETDFYRAVGAHINESFTSGLWRWSALIHTHVFKDKRHIILKELYALTIFISSISSFIDHQGIY